MKTYLLSALSIAVIMGCGEKKEKSTTPPPVEKKQAMVEVVSKEADKKVDILIDGKVFTSYIYPSTIKKPVLWPVVTSGGNEVTRNFPMKNKAGERVDHPHHVGIWLNYGDVNGLDFWNNSDAIPAENADKYGTILHQSIKNTKSGEGQGSLETTSVWNDINGNTLLDESSQFVFKADGDVRVIDRTTTLTAKGQKVTFTDNKEGMFAIRVTRELELPSDKAMELSDSHGVITKVASPDNSSVTGDYLSSEGITGEDVWATRAKWMKLAGKLNGEDIALVIIDHPKNVGYPTYWHARSYGLFSANTLGQKIFSKGETELNFALEAGESVTFKYRFAVISGAIPEGKIEELTNSFGN
jgi:hypothetical protein